MEAIDVDIFGIYGEKKLSRLLLKCNIKCNRNWSYGKCGHKDYMKG